MKNRDILSIVTASKNKKCVISHGVNVKSKKRRHDAKLIKRQRILGIRPFSPKYLSIEI